MNGKILTAKMRRPGQHRSIINKPMMTRLGRQTGPSGSPLGHLPQIAARAVRFKLDLSTSDPAYNVRVDELRIQIKEG